MRRPRRVVPKNKFLNRSREALAFGSYIVGKMAELQAEVEEYHRLKEHLLITLGTRQRHLMLESDDPNVSYIVNSLDKILFSDGDSETR